MSITNPPNALEALRTELAEVEEAIHGLEDRRKQLKKAMTALGESPPRAPRREDNPERLRALLRDQPGLKAREIPDKLGISLAYAYGLLSHDPEIERHDDGRHFLRST
jgi:hypothetical protein